MSTIPGSIVTGWKEEGCFGLADSTASILEGAEEGRAGSRLVFKPSKVFL